MGVDRASVVWGEEESVGAAIVKRDGWWQIETKAEPKAVPSAEPLIRLPTPKKSMRTSVLSMPSFPQ